MCGNIGRNSGLYSPFWGQNRRYGNFDHTSADYNRGFDSTGLIVNAFRAVRIRGTPPSLKEKDQLIKTCLERNKNRDEIKKALIVAKQGVSQETIDLLVKAYIDRKWLDRAIEAENLGCSRSARDELVRSCMKNRKSSAMVQKGIRMAQKGVSQQLLDAAAEICIYNGWLETALNLAKSGISVEILNALKKSSIESGRADIVIALADLSKEDLSDADKDSLVKACIEKRNIDDAIRTADLRGKELSAAEKESFVKRYIKEGNIRNSNKATTLRGRPFSESEKVDFIKAFAGKKYKNDEELNELYKIAQSGLPQTSLDLLVKIYLDRHWGQHAMEIAELGASQETIDLLAKVSLENGWYKHYLSSGYNLVNTHLSLTDKKSLLKKCINQLSD